MTGSPADNHMIDDVPFLLRACKIQKNRIEELEAPFRNADRLDWDHLMQMLPDSGHGRFWKAVFAELRPLIKKST